MDSPSEIITGVVAKRLASTRHEQSHFRFEPSQRVQFPNEWFAFLQQILPPFWPSSSAMYEFF
jgi:hypothetical protein